MRVEDKLAEFVVKTKYHDIPENVREYVKCIMLKTTAGMLYGSTTPSGRKIARMVRGYAPEAGVIGHGFRTSVDKAALADGMFAHAAELEDDCFPTATSDITVFPVVFPLIDYLKLSGKEALEASTVACEVMNRVAEYAMGPDGKVIEQLGFTSLPFYGVIGAAAAAARAFELEVDEVKSALGIAIGTSSGFIMNFGTDAHYYESAVACQNGVIAAMLAKEGCTGNPDIERWLRELIGVSKEKVEKIAEKLGEEPWYATKFWIKKYPVCFLTHRHVDVMIKLLKEHNITYDQIEKVEAELGPIDATVDRPDPKDLEDCRFSIQHVLAGVMLEGDVNVDTVSWEKILDPKFREARSKVKVIVHPEWPKTYMSGVGRVTIYLKDGRKISGERDQVIGGPKYPLTREQFIELYNKYASVVLSEEQLKWSSEVILNIEAYRDLSGLTDLLVFKRP